MGVPLKCTYQTDIMFNHQKLLLETRNNLPKKFVCLYKLKTRLFFFKLTKNILKLTKISHYVASYFVF